MLTVVDVQLGFHVKSLSLHNVLNALVYGGRDLLTLQDWLVRSSSKISDLAGDGKTYLPFSRAPQVSHVVGTKVEVSIWGACLRNIAISGSNILRHV